MTTQNCQFSFFYRGGLTIWPRTVSLITFQSLELTSDLQLTGLVSSSSAKKANGKSGLKIEGTKLFSGFEYRPNGHGLPNEN